MRTSSHWSDTWKLHVWYAFYVNNVFFIILKTHQHFQGYPQISTETSQPNSISCGMDSLSSLSLMCTSWYLPLETALPFSFDLIPIEIIPIHLQKHPSTLHSTFLLYCAPLSFSYPLIFWTPCQKHSASWSRQQFLTDCPSTIPPTWTLTQLWLLWLLGYQKYAWKSVCRGKNWCFVLSSLTGISIKTLQLLSSTLLSNSQNLNNDFRYPVVSRSQNHSW